MKTIVFACIHNAGRSQMAATYFNALADPAMAHAVSAGTKPAGHVHSEVLTVMREAGVDLSGSQPRLLTPDLTKGASLLITMGCGEECPFVPGLRREDWPIDDPKGLPLDSVRKIRDEVRARVERLVDSEGCRARTKPSNIEGRAR
jgi:arsenate reductase